MAGIVYLKDISQTRMSGSACDNLRLFRKLCGDDSLRNVAILTTMWDRVDEEVGMKRQRALQEGDKWFGQMVEHGAIVIRHHDTAESADHVLGHFFAKQPTVLKIQSEMVDEEKSLVLTQAGGELDKQIDKKAERFGKRLKQLEAGSVHCHWIPMRVTTV